MEGAGLGGEDENVPPRAAKGLEEKAAMAAIGGAVAPVKSERGAQRRTKRRAKVREGERERLSGIKSPSVILQRVRNLQIQVYNPYSLSNSDSVFRPLLLVPSIPRA